MGIQYLEASRLIQERQKIPVERAGLISWMCSDHPELYSTVTCINSRGSIEQSLHKHMLGTPHHLHQNCKELEWSISEGLRESFESIFQQGRRLLRAGGIFLIVANGSKNDLAYDEIVKKCAARSGLEFVGQQGPLIHKWRKQE